MSKKHHNGPAVLPHTLGMPPCGADSHAHLDLKHFRDDLPGVLERAKAAGVTHIGNVFLSPAAWRDGRELFRDEPGVFFLLGIHPTDGDQWDEGSAHALREAFSQDARLKAVGEIGLDFYWKDCLPETQYRVFATQLALAKELQKPVVIHSRDAFRETVDTLLAHDFSGYPLLWHCFGGDTAQAEELLGHGWHISVPGPATYPSNQALRDAVAVIPADRLLLETDCPYLSPVPYRGKRNEPAYTVFTAQAVAVARGMAVEDLWCICGDNTRRFFRL